MIRQVPGGLYILVKLTPLIPMMAHLISMSGDEKVISHHMAESMTT